MFFRRLMADPIYPISGYGLGCYWLTKDRDGARGEEKIFSSTDEVRIAYDSQEVEDTGEDKSTH